MKEEISIVIMNHGRLGEEMIASAEMIFGKMQNVSAISLMPGMSIGELMELAETVVMPSKENTIILADLYGGTPCNVAMMLRQRYGVNIICGVNLPMLIELVSSRALTDDPDELARKALNSALEGIKEPPVEMADEAEEL